MNSPCSSNIGSVLPSLISASTAATNAANLPLSVAANCVSHNVSSTAISSNVSSVGSGMCLKEAGELIELHCSRQWHGCGNFTNGFYQICVGLSYLRLHLSTPLMILPRLSSARSKCFHNAAQRLALHLPREAQRSGVRWKRGLGDACTCYGDPTVAWTIA